MSAPEAKVCDDSAEQRGHEAVADSTGIALTTVIWISSALTFVGLYQRKSAADRHVNADGLCRMLVSDLNEFHLSALTEHLNQAGIHSSCDIGRVVYALIKTGLCRPTDSDTESDFAGVFETDQIDVYLRQTGIRDIRDWPMALKSTLVWAFYLGGLALFIACNQQLMPSAPVWAGGLLFFLGWMISRSRYPKPMRFGLPWSTLERRTRRSS